MLNHILQPVARGAILRGFQPNIIRSSQKYGFKSLTLDDATEPNGSWKDMNRKFQRKNNIHLLLGAGSLVVTLIIMFKWDSVFYNFTPPKINK